MSVAVLGGTGKRLATGACAIPVVVAALWAPSLEWGVDLIVVLLVGRGIYEYARMTRAAGINVMPALDILTGMGLVAFNSLALWLWWRPMGGVPVVGGLSGALLILASARLFSGRHDLSALAVDFFGVAYIAGLSCYLTAMNHSTDMGPGFVTFLLVAVAFSDTGAYFVGRTFGRHKLAPLTSPKKSWEGAVGGVAFAVIAVLVLWLLVARFGWQRHYPPMIWWAWMVLAAVLSVVGQIGDLVESMIKREMGVKDTGRFFPGHGGVLDRCDSILFAAPALYYLYAGGMALAWLITNR